MPLYALVDCNNFYASCERVFAPHLEGKPIVVLSGNDGCIIARSQEAKDLGIGMGVPEFQVRHIIRSNKVTALSSNFELYGDLSSRVMSILAETSLDMEIYSIDEAFLDFSNVSNAFEYASELRAKIKQWTGIPTSIGLAPTKTLGKMANMIAKKRTTNGVFEINKDNLSKTLESVSVDEIWGIGAKSANKLKLMGIFTAEQLRKANHVIIRKALSINGEKTLMELNMIASVYVEDVPAKQSIQTSRSFGTDVTNIEDLISAVSYFVLTASEKLRSQQKLARNLYVYARSNPHKSNSNRYYYGLSYDFSTPTDDTSFINNIAIKLIKAFYKNGCSYKKAGIVLSDLTDKAHLQVDIFDQQEPTPNKEPLMLALDRINHKYGGGTLHMASQNLSNKWQSKKDNMSHRFTTRWNELKICK